MAGTQENAEGLKEILNTLPPILSYGAHPLPGDLYFISEKLMS